MQVKNITKAARGIWNKEDKLIMILPGETVDIDVSSATLSRLERKSGTFSLSKSIDVTTSEDAEVKTPEVDLSGSEEDALRADLEGLGVKVDKRWGLDRLQSELDKALTEGE